MKRVRALSCCLVAMPLLACGAIRPAASGGSRSSRARPPSSRIPSRDGKARASTSDLTSENSVWTEPRSRAEVFFGPTALRLGEATQLDIVQPRRRDAARPRRARHLTVRIRDFDRGEILLRHHARRALPAARQRALPDRHRPRTRRVAPHRLLGQRAPRGGGRHIDVDTGRSVRVTGGERPRYEFEVASVHRARRLGARPRRALRRARGGTLRPAADDRLGGPRRLRRLAQRGGIRRRVVPDPRRSGLGTVPIRPLDLGASLGLVLGGRRALGLRTLPLRPLGCPSATAGPGIPDATRRGPCGPPPSSAGSAARGGASRYRRGSPTSSAGIPLSPYDRFQPWYAPTSRT